MNEVSPAPSLINFGLYLVVYIDLLVQANELQEIRRVPITDDEKHATEQVLQRTAWRVHMIRQCFNDLVADHRTQVYEERLAALPEAARESYKRVREFEIRQIGFSDSFAISVPLHDASPEGLARAAWEVWLVLVGTAAICLLAMAQKIPLRGGITVGTGVDLFKNEAYGAALVDAHRLESTVAEYNRVVVGADLLDYLNALKGLSPDNPFHGMAREQAAKCFDLICLAADDKLPMLHMLSREVLALPSHDHTGTWEGLRAPARTWVEAEAHRFVEQRDYKLASRYHRLLAYFDASEPTPPRE
jgi:hypothetical protein